MQIPILLRQTATITYKDIKLVVWHHGTSTFFRALAPPPPIAYVYFIAYVGTFFLPPSEYGIGSPNLVRHLTTEGFNSSTDLGGRDRIVFIDNGFTGGHIEALIDALATPLKAAGADVRRLSNEEELLTICQSLLSGLSRYYGAVAFQGSPTEGNEVWSYTARGDFGLGFSPYVDRDDNNAQVFVLPFVRAIDAGIASLSGLELPDTMLEFPFTHETRQDRADEIKQFFMRALGNYLAVSMFIGICGITYHLPGHLAAERESGISSLIDSMLYARHLSQAMLARLTSIHLSFAVVYTPSWLAIGAIVKTLMFTETPASIIVPFHLLAGLALTGQSIFFASFFRKAQLRGITTLLFGLILAIITQFVPRETTTIIALSALLPSVTYSYFQIQVASRESVLMPPNLSERIIWWDTIVPGYLMSVFSIIQIVAYPLLAAAVQWSCTAHLLAIARTSNPRTHTWPSSLQT